MVIRLASGPRAVALIVDALLDYADAGGHGDPQEARRAVHLANQLGDALDAMPLPDGSRP